MSQSESAAIDTAISTAAALAESGGASSAERRTATRHPFGGKVELFLLTEQSGVLQPLVVQGRDVSTGGLSVMSRQMINPGREGVARLTRSDHSTVIIGVKVVRSCYMGEMRHETGLQFIAVPEELRRQLADDEDIQALLRGTGIPARSDEAVRSAAGAPPAPGTAA